MSATNEITTGVLTTGMASVAALASGVGDVHAQGIDSWVGSYAGLSVGTRGGSFWSYSDDDYNYLGDAVFGAFVGHRWTAGSVLLGAELSYSPTTVGMEDNGAVGDPDDYAITNLVDLSFSAGTVVGPDILVYGFAGLSAGGMFHERQDGDGYFTLGANYGIGADYMVNDMISVGARITGRSMRLELGDDFGDAGFNQSHEFSLRAAFHF